MTLAGCGNDEQAVGSPGDADLAGRTFIAQAIEGYEPVAGTEISITFEADQVQAHAGCNHLLGQLTSTDGGVLAVSNMGTTDMGCDSPRHDQDTWLIDFLVSSPSWGLAGDELRLQSTTAEIMLVDRVVAHPDRALEGTRWVVDSLISGSGDDAAASSTPSQAEAFLVMTDGRVEGSNGCNSIGGDYRVDGETLVFLEMFNTLVGCLEPDVAAFEESVMAVFNQPMRYEIVADRLTLTAPDGSGLGLHADS